MSLPNDYGPVHEASRPRLVTEEYSRACPSQSLQVWVGTHRSAHSVQILFLYSQTGQLQGRQLSLLLQLTTMSKQSFGRSQFDLPKSIQCTSKNCKLKFKQNEDLILNREILEVVLMLSMKDIYFHDIIKNTNKIFKFCCSYECRFQPQNSEVMYKLFQMKKLYSHAHICAIYNSIL